MGCVPAVVRLPSAKREFRRDAVSTLNSDKILDLGEEFDYVRADVVNRVAVALTAKEIEQVSYDDEELSVVKICVRSGKWSQCKAAVSFVHAKNELCLYG